MTYGDIISEFCQKFPNAEYEDIRPCCEAYGVPNIAYAIVVWLKDKSKLIYISDNARKFFEKEYTMKKEYIVEWDWEYYAFDSEPEAVAFAEEQWNSVSKEDQDEVEKMQVYEVETESGIRMMAYEDNKNFMTRMIKNYKEKDIN